VLSPSTAARDRADKVPIYLRERVAFVWLVDPDPSNFAI
jgi:Uma2 family endonuclease